MKNDHMKKLMEWVNKRVSLTERAIPVLESINSIIMNPSFIQYRPDKQKELENIKYIDWMYKWDDPVIFVSVYDVEPEWVVDNILYPLRQRFGCFYDLEISELWKDINYKTTIKDIPVTIQLSYAKNCEWKKKNSKSTVYEHYEMVCNGLGE